MHRGTNVETQEAGETSGHGEFCTKCQPISAKLEQVFERGFEGHDLSHRYGGRRVTERGDLDHISKKPQESECGLCEFLSHMASGYHLYLSYMAASYQVSLSNPLLVDLVDAVELYLFVGLAKEKFNIPSSCQVTDSFLLWMWPTERPDQSQILRLPTLPYPMEGGSSSGVVGLEVSIDTDQFGGRVLKHRMDFQVTRSWFDHCAKHHDDTCRVDTSIVRNIPDFKVLDCSSRRLVSWSALPKDQYPQYVALSYVWGTTHGAGEAPTVNSNSPINERLPCKLPQLIEDAIITVIKLGFRYLWIDRYCIPQDNPEAKHTQIQNMDKIYGSACLTIIAAAGNDPFYGLAGVSPRLGRLRADVSTSVRLGPKTFVTIDTEFYPDALRQSKWNSRAWTMQEGFLSCRCLVLLENGAYFQCSSPKSHRFEAIHDPSALLKLRHEVHKNEGWPNPLVLTKIGRVEHSELDWCLQLVRDYFLRSMTFEEDTLNAFSGMLQHLQSLKPPILNLWGILIIPNSTTSGEPISYNILRELAWSINREKLFFQNGFGKLEQPTILPRKGMFPSWTWADWRPRSALDGESFTSRLEFEPLPIHTDFTSLVEMSLELDDGRIVSIGQGDVSDLLWLTNLRNPPRILHLNGYSSNPQLRYMTEAEWAGFCERTVIPTQEDLEKYGGAVEVHSCSNHSDWALTDADGDHLQLPFCYHQYVKPWCWGTFNGWLDLSIDAYHFQRQRGYQTETFKPHEESTFDFRVILLGYDKLHVFYMFLMKTPGTDGQTETFERVNVILKWKIFSSGRKNSESVEEFLAKLTGKQSQRFRGTPWVKMSTRIA